MDAATAADLIRASTRRSSPPSWVHLEYDQAGEILKLSDRLRNDVVLRIATSTACSRPR